jgi:hypothetical protein
MKKPTRLSLLSGKILGILNNVRILKDRIVRLIEYIPVIWNTRDWDHAYTTTILAYQLNRQANYIEGKKHIANWKYISDRIRLAARLIKAEDDGMYVDIVVDLFNAEWGKSEIKFEPYDDNSYSLVGLVWENAKDTEENERVNDLFSEEMAEAAYKERKAVELGWKIIQKDMKTWWD